MSERTERFEVTGTPRLSVRLPAGEVRVVAGLPGEVVVRARGGESDLSRMVIEARGDTITLEPDKVGWHRWASLDVEIAVGAPPEIRARLASGGLLVRTPAAGLDAATASGSVEAGEVAGRLTARLASGDLVAGAAGSLDVVSASGDVRVPQVRGEAAVKTASGDVTLGVVGGDLTVRTASGDVSVSRLEGNRGDAKTVSGDVRLGVPPGRRYTVSLQSLSGDVRTDFPIAGEGGGAPGRLQVATVSGNIRITGATAG
jgi:DUF4097 and DUF4098 domain-containing protein YvlB